MERAISIDARRALRQELLDLNDEFVLALPKVELHVHIEGTLTPELRWKFAQRNGQTLQLERTGTVYTSLEQLKESYGIIKPRPGHRIDNAEETFTFFEAYYGGFEVLVTERDFFDLAMHYFERAASMNVRYCEPFFDAQGHTRRGISWDTMMGGFRAAQEEAEKTLGIKSSWIMCFLRDLSPESAMEHYQAVLPYRDMIVGIGLASSEDNRPPCLFEEVFALAKQAGFRITAHCDVGAKNTHEHIRQVASVLGGSGAHRIDHGLNAAQRPELMQLIKQNGIGMTITPYGYTRHQPLDEIFSRIRALYDAGIQVAIASDDPAFHEDTWILQDMLLVKMKCGFTNEDMAVLARNAVDMCWAPDTVREEIRNEIEAVVARFSK